MSTKRKRVHLSVRGTARLDADGHVRAKRAEGTWRDSTLEVTSADGNPPNVTMVAGHVIRARGPISVAFANRGVTVNGMPLATFERRQRIEEERRTRAFTDIDIDLSAHTLACIEVHNGKFTATTGAERVDEVLVTAKNSSTSSATLPRLPRQLVVEAKNSSTATVVIE